MGSNERAALISAGVTMSCATIGIGFKLAFPDMIVPFGWALALLITGVVGLLATIVFSVKALFFAKRPSASNFRLTVENVAWGGDDPSLVLAIISVENIGAAPSALTAWRVWARWKESGVPLNILHPSSATVSLKPKGQSALMSFSSANAIYNKTVSPVIPGTLVQGFLIAKNDDGAPIFAGAELWVGCRDVFGRTYRGSFVLTGTSGSVAHFPGMT